MSIFSGAYLKGAVASRRLAGKWAAEVGKPVIRLDGAMIDDRFRVGAVISNLDDAFAFVHAACFLCPEDEEIESAECLLLELIALDRWSKNWQDLPPPV